MRYAGLSKKERNQLLALAVRLLAGAVPKHRRAAMHALAQEALRQALRRTSATARVELRKRLAATKPARLPEELSFWLRREFGLWGLELWLTKNHGPPAPAGGRSALRKLAREWLAWVPAAVRDALLEAATRFAIGRARIADGQQLQTSFREFRKEKEKTMAAKFDFDSRGLPGKFFTDKNSKGVLWKDAFDAEVKNLIENSFGFPEKGNETLHAAVKGMLLLDGQIFTDSSGFRGSVGQVMVETRGSTLLKDGKTEKFNRDTYTMVLAEILKIRDPGGAAKDVPVFYQELASVSRYVIERAKDVPVDHDSFKTQVLIGLSRYVEGPAPFESLDLPKLTGADGADDEIVSENIRSVGLIYASQQLERMRLFHVVDKITELFMHGMLPIGFDNGGKLLDRYYWDRENRLTEGERLANYGRVLGTTGADIPKDVPANQQLDNRLVRFISNLAEYDRQRRIGDLLDGAGRALTLTGELVRKSGRDLGGNASAFGWGGTQFAARRINGHIQQSLEILREPNIQKVYGVSNPYAVIEQVAAKEFGQSPNIVKYRTMAESGEAILRMVAKYARVWSTTGQQALFEETDRGGKLIPGDIPAADRDELVRHAQYWLAVNGIADEQVNKLSQPVETTAEPSVPVFRGGTGAPVGMNGGLDQLRQMVAAGNAPSLDQLKQLIPGLK